MLPRMNPPRLPLRRKLALLLTVALLINCFVPVLSSGESALAAPRALPPAEPQAAQSDFVREVPLATKDIIYDKNSKKIYASVPSYAGSRGNSITPIDPSSGTIGSSVFVGSEPGKLAISDNGQYLYTNLEGALAIRRFDLASQTPGLQYAIPNNVSDMLVLAGKPESIAVATSGSVAVYDNDVRRTTTASSPNFASITNIEPFSSADTILGTAGFSTASLLKIGLDANGATVSSSTATSASGDARYDNGRVYFATGQVIDANTGALVGTFPNLDSSALVVPDSSVGRVYFLVNSSTFGTLSLRAYDMNTFVLLGSMTIPNISSARTSLIRWGANGLAFRTTADSSGNVEGSKLYIIQTSLVPSAEPVPTPLPSPTPTPSPSPSPTPANSVTQIPLPSNDLVYDASRQLIYASVPSVTGSTGNSITSVNPATGEIGTPVYVGSEPGKVVLTDDAHYLYTTLDGAGAIRRVDLINQSAGLQFSLGGSTTFSTGPFWARDLAALPGSPEALAIIRTTINSTSSGTVAIYDNGVQRPTLSAASNFLMLTPSASASTLYGMADSTTGLQKISLNASGVSSVTKLGTISGGNEMVFDNGSIYMSDGRVVDATTGALKGTFFGVNSSFSTLSVVPDSTIGRVFFLTSNGSSSVTLRAYDMNTFLLIGTLTVPNVTGFPSSLVRWGTNGLAFRANGSSSGSSFDPTNTNSKIYIVQTALVSNAPIKPVTAPTPQPTPFPPSVEVNQIALTANDIIYDKNSKKIYASVPGSAGSNGNSLTEIDPLALTVGSSVFVGSEPNRLAISDNNQYIYVGLDGAAAVRRFDLATKTPGLQFSLGSSPGVTTMRATDIEVMPSSPQTVAVSKPNSGFGNIIAIYDNDVLRTGVNNSNLGISNFIEFSGADTIFSTDPFSSNPNLLKFTVSAQGATLSRTTPGYSAGDFKIANGRIYLASGYVFDVQTGGLLGRFAGLGFNSFVAPDPANGRVFFVDSNTGGISSTATIRAYDINTFLPLGSIQIPLVSGTPSSLIRWGVNGLAFRTAGNIGGQGTQVYLIRTSLVSPAEVIPPTIKLSAATYSVNELSSTPATITVTRSGDNTAQATVDYATSNGTATAGSDYTAKSGTLTFAPGEFTKTITVPILDDNVFEGVETFNITLSNANGASLVSPSTAVVSIVDNESKPFISVTGPGSITEPGTGTVDAVYTVRLTSASTLPVTVDYITVDGTATVAGNDYVPTSGTLTFNPGETAKNITIQVKADDLIEGTESFFLDLKNFTNASNTSNSHIQINILDASAGILQFSAGSYSVQENVGNAQITVTRGGGSIGTVSVAYATSSSSATPGKDYTETSGTLTFGPGETSKTFNVPIIDDSVIESNEGVFISLNNPTGGAIIGPQSSTLLIIVDDDTPQVTLSSPSYTVSEGDPSGVATITVKRSGLLTAAVSVDYATSDIARLTPCAQTTGQASERCDYATTIGTLKWNAGEGGTKTFTIPIVNDAIVEGNETFTVTLSNVKGAALASPSLATVTITDDGNDPSPQNPIDDPSFFIREQYSDFLGRTPDPTGFKNWQDTLGNCPGGGFGLQNADCDRVKVAMSTFQSEEFQTRGYWAYRFYEVAFGRRPNYAEFIPDMALIGGPKSPAEGEASKQQFINAFVLRQEFVGKYGALTDPTQYVDALLQTAGLPNLSIRSLLISDLQASRITRAQALEQIVETKDVEDKFYNRGFISMLYFGFVRRDPDPTGFDNHINNLANPVGDYTDKVRHIVFDFIYSTEYRGRFGQP